MRQLTNAAGEVLLAKGYEPYGEVLNSAGSVSTSYGYTGEWTSASDEMVYLRARWYSAQIGRFITRDTWEGVETRPMSYNTWQYGYSNPLLYVDRSGHTPDVECDKILLPDLRSLCKVADGDDNDPNVVDARYRFFWKIGKYSKLLSIYNNGFWWAGDMLQHFLLKGGYRDVTLPYGTSFARDPGIARAIKEKLPPKRGYDEPKEITPLLYKFLSGLEPQIDCGIYQGPLRQKVYSKDTYVSKYDPRPHGMGWWGAFGHVRVNAEYSNIIAFPTFSNDAYVVRTQVRYSADEQYQWFGGLKDTPLPLGTLNWDADHFPPVQLVFIPHTWEDSLVSKHLASEYDYTITWSEYMQIVVLEDFSYFLIVGEGKWLPLE